MSVYNRNMVKVRKAIIPAAGLGTRFLPQTKAMPKEMLPLIDKPVIQHIVEQCVAAGVEDIIIVTGAQKRAIEDHFDRSYDLEERLRDSGKHDKADELKRIANLANFIYVRQKGTYGNATPLMNVKHLLGEEPFFYFFADDLFMGQVPEPQQLLEIYKETNSPVMSLRHVGIEGADRYGMVSVSEDINETTVKINGVLEKPGKDNAPSEFATVSGYLLTPEFLPYLDQYHKDAGGEHSVPVTLGEFAKDNPVYGKYIEGKYLDTGSKGLYAEALVEIALDDPKIRDDFASYLKNKVKTL